MFDPSPYAQAVGYNATIWGVLIVGATFALLLALHLGWWALDYVAFKLDHAPFWTHPTSKYDHFGSNPAELASI